MDSPTYVDLLVDSFVDAGITHAFAVTGGAIAPFTNSLVLDGRIIIEYFLTEQAAGIAAEAFGYYGSKPALLVVTSGPGVTNALTPVAAAWANSSPIIVISGQARSSDVSSQKNTKNRQIGNQHLSTPEIVRTFTKTVLEPIESSDPIAIAQYLTLLSTNLRPGPVWLSLSLDIQRKLEFNAEHKQIFETQLEIEPADNGISLDIFYRLLLEAQRPAFLLGAGARGGKSDLIDFARKYNIPLLTTWPGLDLVGADDPLFCGRPGSIPSSRTPNLIIQNCDLLIVVGARLDLPQVGFNPEKFATKARVLRIDVDEKEFLRIPPRDNWTNIKLSSEVFGNLLKDITFKEIEKADLSDWWSILNEWKTTFKQSNQFQQENLDGISTYLAVNNLAKSFYDYTIVTGSSGTCMEMLLQSWPVQSGQRLINSCGIGSMGFGFYAAIGVALKDRRKDILAIDSDGSFFMNPMSIVEAKLKNLKIKFVLLDSQGYKSISLSQKRLGQVPHGADLSSGLVLPNLELYISNLGLPMAICTENSELQDGVKWLRELDTSGVLILSVSQSEEALPRLISAPDKHGAMVSPDFEKVSPMENISD